MTWRPAGLVDVRRVLVSPKLSCPSCVAMMVKLSSSLRLNVAHVLMSKSFNLSPKMLNEYNSYDAIKLVFPCFTVISRI